MTLKNRQLIKITLSIAFVFLIAIPASSQEMKIGVVNLQAIAERSPQTKALYFMVTVRRIIIEVIGCCAEGLQAPSRQSDSHLTTEISGP